MIEVVVAIEVRRSAADAFAFLSEWGNNPRWQKGTRSCTWTSDPPLRAGSTYDQVASFLGREIRSSFEVVQFEPGRLVRIKTTASSLPLDITRQVTPLANGGCTIEATVRGEPGGAARLFNPLTRLMVQRSVRADYRRLQALLDADAA